MLLKVLNCGGLKDFAIFLYYPKYASTIYVLLYGINFINYSGLASFNPA